MELVQKCMKIHIFQTIAVNNLILKEGMTLAIEPMFSLHSRKVWMLEDGWTITTQDGSPAAHFEHTIVVTKDGYKILTGE